MDVVVDRNFWQAGIIFINLLDNILILIRIKGRQNFNAEEKQSYFFEKLKIKKCPLKWKGRVRVTLPLVSDIRSRRFVRLWRVYLREFHKIVTRFYFLILFLLKLISPIIPMLKKSISAVVKERPSCKATQLIPTTGNKLARTIVLRLSCFAMKSAKGGEYV